MQVVINISEARFRDVQRIAEVQLESNHFKTAEQIIANGTPLPKGHGRLIDADKFLKDNEDYTGWILNSSDWGGENAYKDTLEDLVNDAPTIIEAESEE